MENSICSKCNYSLNIVKDISPISDKKIFSIKTVDKFLEYIKKIKKNNIDEDFDFEFGFKETDLIEYLKKKV